jgi:cystathionine beta-lyase family protein involved in aluminum resistance
MINITGAIYKLYPQVVTIRGDIAYDVNENEVAYDLQSVIAQAQADAQAVIDTKASALAKLAALGLTQDEVKALVG